VYEHVHLFLCVNVHIKCMIGTGLGGREGGAHLYVKYSVLNHL